MPAISQVLTCEEPKQSLERRVAWLMILTTHDSSSNEPDKQGVFFWDKI